MTADRPEALDPPRHPTGRHHVLISGTGRAGTTFLVQLLTALGMDTGFSDFRSGVHANCNAGMELDIRDSNSPYIIKNPCLCDYLDEVARQGVVIDHAVIPIRDLHAAAESRRAVTRKAPPGLRAGEVPGGLWSVDAPARTLLCFPRFIHDPEYLYAKIGFLAAGIGYGRFLEAFRTVVRPELVHDFTTASTRPTISA